MEDSTADKGQVRVGESDLGNGSGSGLLAVTELMGLVLCGARRPRDARTSNCKAFGGVSTDRQSSMSVGALLTGIVAYA